MSRPMIPPPGDRPAPDPRAEILSAAAALLDEGGAEGLTIRRLVMRSGYKAPAIYQHFGDKAGLLDALLERVFQGLVERLEKIPQTGDPVELTRIQFREIARFGREHPTHWRLLEMHPDEAQSIPSVEAAQERLERPVADLASAGRLRIEDEEMVRQSFWALLHGLISLPTSRPDVEWREGLADVAFEAMLAGLLRSGEDGR